MSVDKLSVLEITMAKSPSTENVAKVLFLREILPRINYDYWKSE